MSQQVNAADDAFEQIAVASLEAMQVMRRSVTRKNAEGETLMNDDLPTREQNDAARFVIEHAPQLLEALAKLRSVPTPTIS